MQTDATTPNIVGPTMLGPAGHCGKDTTHTSLQTMRNEPVWSQQCWKSWANGSNIVALRFVDLEQKKCWELLAGKFDRFQTLRINTQQHPTTCNRV